MPARAACPSTLMRMLDAAPTTAFDAALRGMLVALLALLAAVLARDRPRLLAARAGIALCLVGLCVQVVGSTPLLEARLALLCQAPLVAVAVGNAVLFWVFVQALFDDDFVFRPLHGLAWAVVALLSAFNCIVEPRHALAPVTFGLQRAVPLLFAVLAAVAAAAHWRADLVEGRRRLRAFIVVTGVAYTLVMLVARLAAPQGRLSGTVATLDVAMLLLMLTVVAAGLLHLGTSELFPSAPTPEPSTAPTSALTTAPTPTPTPTLNPALPAPPDPAKRELPVLTLALDAGFQSIDPFNRAFKTATGLTPTEFRRQKLADS